MGAEGMEQMDCQTSRLLGHEQSLLAKGGKGKQAWEVVFPSGMWGQTS